MNLYQGAKAVQYFLICLVAKATWSLISRHAVNPSMGARARRPVSHGLETRDHTPLAKWVFKQWWILIDLHNEKTNRVILLFCVSQKFLGCICLALVYFVPS